jgi:RNA polymerase sigma-70 factor (ECF subfamily)
MSSSIADLALLGRLFEEQRPRLLTMLQRRMDPALAARVGAEDILTEAFLQARRRWGRFREQSDLTAYAWLYRIALDCLIEAWRRETRAGRDLHRAMPWPEASSVQLGLGLVCPGTSPSEAAGREELRQKVRQTVDLLKESDREILWMRHDDQLTFPEAAQVLGITESAATLRYVRALKRLKPRPAARGQAARQSVKPER